MFQKFSEDTKKILKRSKKEMQELKHPFVGTEHFILSCLKNKDLEITKILNNYNVDYNNFKKELINIIGEGCSLNSYFIYTPMFKRVLENTIMESQDNNINEISINNIFLSLLDEGEGVGIRVLINLGIDIDELYSELEEVEHKTIKYKTKKKLSIYEHGVDLVEKAINKELEKFFNRIIKK